MKKNTSNAKRVLGWEMNPQGNGFSQMHGNYTANVWWNDETRTWMVSVGTGRMSIYEDSVELLSTAKRMAMNAMVYAEKNNLLDNNRSTVVAFENHIVH